MANSEPRMVTKKITCIQMRPVEVTEEVETQDGIHLELNDQEAKFLHMVFNVGNPVLETMQRVYSRSALTDPHYKKLLDEAIGRDIMGRLYSATCKQGYNTTRPY